MIQNLADALNGTVHGDLITVGDFIIRCTMTGKVVAQHRFRPGTFDLGRVNDGVSILASNFISQEWLY